jgi:acetyl esterase/lipase
VKTLCFLKGLAMASVLPILVQAQTVTLSSNDTSAAESSGTVNGANVTFTRTGATTNALTVNVAYSGSANSNLDLVSAPASVTIPAGVAAATVTLIPVDDVLVEGQETLAVRLVAGAGYVLGSTTTIVIQITDNDDASPLITFGIVYAGHMDGSQLRDVKLNVYRPSSGAGPWPVIIFFPGGGWVSQNENSIPTTITNFTANGFAVVSASYISSTIAKWPAQIQDAKAAVRWVRANAATYGFDPSKIGVTGVSSGGHISAYVGASGGRSSVQIDGETVDLVGSVGGNFGQSDVVQASAPFFPPADLLSLDHYPTPANVNHAPADGLIGAPIQSVSSKTATAAPIALLPRSAGLPALPAFWITHGSIDDNVSFNQSELLTAALVRQGQTPTFWPVQGGGHGPGVIDSAEVISLLQAFMERQLKGVTSNVLPVANFTTNVLTGTAPLTVNFDGNSSTDADGVITKFSWSNGDHTGASGATMSYTYTKPGVYPVTLAVRDDAAGSASKTINIVVNPASTVSATPPTASISAPNSGAIYVLRGDLVLQANAAAQTPATLSNVEFFLNGQNVGYDNVAPFTATLTGLAPGVYAATARATDSSGAVTTSAAISFTVRACDVFCSGFEN